MRLTQLVGAFFLCVAFGASGQSSSRMTELGSQVKQKAELAVAQFQKRAGGKLNYSPASLATVEEMLAEASEYGAQTSPKDKEALVQLMGSYVLQVAFLEHGGKFYWNERRNQPVLVVGEPAYRVAIMTFDKVRGRLSGDKADNIPFFYEGFSTRVRTAKPGTDALYI